MSVIDSATDQIPGVATTFWNILTDMVFVCTENGIIHSANLAATRWSDRPPEGQPFESLIVFDETHKARKFLEAIRNATPDNPTTPWEMVIGTTAQYTVATFRGYRISNGDNGNDGMLLIVGTIQSEEVGEMQQEMLELTSELAEAQREVRRQNRALQQSVSDQRQMVRTIMKISAPSVPIWDAALLLSLTVGTQNKDAIELIREIWQRAGGASARYVILDLSNTRSTEPVLVQRVIDCARILEHLGVQPVLADGGSGMVRAITRMDENWQQLKMYSDIHRAVAYIGSQTMQESQETAG